MIIRNKYHALKIVFRLAEETLGHLPEMLLRYTRGGRRGVRIEAEGLAQNIDFIIYIEKPSTTTPVQPETSA